MTTQTTHAQNSEQQAPSLKDLIGFDLPRLTRHFTEKNVGYSINCDQQALGQLKKAARIASQIIRDGNEAIIDLLLTVDLYCPNEGNRFSRINALALLFELSGALRSIDDTEFILDRAEALFADVTESAKKQA